MDEESYEIELSCVDHEDSVSTKRKTVYIGGEGLASFGWCMGQEIADAIISLSNHLTNKNLNDIFEAIVDRKEDYNKEYALVVGEIK